MRFSYVKANFSYYWVLISNKETLIILEISLLLSIYCFHYFDLSKISDVLGDTSVCLGLMLGDFLIPGFQDDLKGDFELANLGLKVHSERCTDCLFYSSLVFS